MRVLWPDASVRTRRILGRVTTRWDDERRRQDAGTKSADRILSGDHVERRDVRGQNGEI